MKFSSAGWLWGLILLPMVYAIFEIEMRKRRSMLEDFIKPGLWKTLLPAFDPEARARKVRMWIAAAACLIVAMARPQWGYREESMRVSGLDIVFALDISNSMLVEDVVPSRLKKAKHIARGILDRLGGDRVALVPFAGSNYLASPLTTDIGYLRDILETLEPEAIPTQGTNLGAAMETSARALERGAEDLSRKDAGTLPSKVVIVLTDGEDFEGKAMDSIQSLSEAGVRLFMIGVGSEKGGPVPVRDPGGVLRGFKRRDGGDPVISVLDRAGLKAIASAAGGRYFDASPEESEVDDIVSSMGSMERTDFSERKYVVYQERFQIPLFIGVILLLLELSLPVRRTLGAAILIAGLFSGLASTSARADSLDLFLENEKGKKAYEEGRMDEARRRFGGAQAYDPDNATLLFNQSLIQLQQGETESAVKGFSEAAKSAFAKGDEGLASRSLYNLGVSKMKAGDFSGAADAFSKSINIAERQGDEKLENDARKKLVRMAQESQQQKQEKKEGGEGEQEQKQDQKEQSGGDPKDDKKQDGSEGNKDKQKRYSQGNKGQKKFNSKKLSKEDAERVMAELSENEKQLKAKLSKQQGRQQRTDKDW